MRILVVGPGAIGSLFAGMLTSGGHEVWLLGRRREVVDTINREGITIEQVWTGATLRIPVRATVDPCDAAPAVLIVMCVKSPGTLQATRDALPAAGEGTVFLTVQNGLRNVDIMASVVGRERVLAGVTSNGTTLLGPGSIRHSWMGDTTIGELDGQVTERLERVAEAFRQSRIKVAVSRSVDQLLWTKLMANCAMSPLAALLQVRNGQLVERPEARELLRAVVREVVSVAEAKGVALPPYSEAVEKVETNCRNNATNKMSMLQDVERGAPTEIDYINGAVVREGEAVGIPTPINWTLTQLVKALSYPAEGALPSPEPPAR
jgi:2-dehydropantoate 2-reductase